ncbi:thermostable alkaline protease precursor [Fusarium mexicanum]|uniref:Thermostable alkaline protease n=1 Tax=Fusarium mexicanum TaxID=751941 RepID=A0A8H5MPP9_9HYPO|nr:thermostable alkaline protease precursor [Fusarium mexicanum]
MDNTSLWDYACRSSKEVAAISGRLVAKSQVSWQPGRNRQPSERLAKLAAYLLLTYFDNNKHESGVTEHSPQRTKLFLEALERICTWPPREVHVSDDAEFAVQFPTLNALLQHASQEHKTWQLESDLVPKIEKSLKAFIAIKKITLKRYFSFLEGFSSTKKHVKQNAEAIRTDISTNSGLILETPNDYPNHVLQAFYNISRRYLQCCNPVEQICVGRHDGKLRLKENFQTSGDNVVFDTVLSRVPPNNVGVEWQHLQFHVPRSKKQVGMKAVGFASKADLTPAASNTTKAEIQYERTISNNTQLCDLIRWRVGPAKVRVKVSGKTLLQYRDLGSLDDDLAHEHSITLADMLKHQQLGSKKKLIIAYILARSFWQYYNSDWMCSDWSAESVQFFQERTGDDHDAKGDSVLSSSPYFSFSFGGNDPLLDNEYLATICVVHRYPRVLALAKLLYTIGRKKHREGKVHSGKRGCVSTVEQISNECNDIKRGLARKTWPDITLQPEVQQTYKAIVENCIDPKLFEPTGNSTGDMTVDERRSILHKKVVYPLQALLQKLNWVDDDGNIRQEEDADLRTTEIDPGVAASPTQATFLSHPKSLDGDQTSKFESEKWLRRIQEAELTELLVQGFKRNPSLQRVRIAVLDTGYDPEVVMFQNPQHKRRIRDWKDFALGSSSPEDQDGHGTYVLSLLMKVAPSVDIYVARIAKNTEALESSAKKISEALHWAATTCKADIITMSFGFEEELPFEGDCVISNAISNVLASRKQQILFFAAAANEGGNQSEMFPASHAQVMSIRGTNAKGWLEHFSPPPGDCGTCFMTLGKDVPGASLSHDVRTDVYESGTSATPNFSYHVNTSICIGDIIQDPSDPTKPLSSPPESLFQEIESHVDYDNALSQTTSGSLHGSIWAKFLESVDANVGGGASNERFKKYTMDRLETLYYKKQPTDEQAEERIKHPKVKAAIKSGVFGKSPVYMITALKVARGFRVESGKTSSKEGNAGSQAPVASDIDLGAEVSVTSQKNTQESYRSGQDIIFAYQLHIISHKGWRQRDTDIRVFKSKAAFLHEDKEVAKEEPMEIQHATEGDVREFDDEMPLDVLSALEDGELCVCIAFGDE